MECTPDAAAARLPAASRQLLQTPLEERLMIAKGVDQRGEFLDQAVKRLAVDACVVAGLSHFWALQISEFDRM